MSVSGRLVGRGPALAFAGAALDGALAGTGRLLLLAGDPGIGKTALAREVAEDAGRRGARVLWAACPPGGGAPAYWPWSQVMRDLAPVVAMPSEVRRLLPGATAVAATDDAAARFELYDGVVRALSEAARESAVVVVLDDLQWADEPSLVLLDVVARQAGGRRLLLLGTYRDVEASATLNRVAGAGEALTLGGLDASAVTGLVTAITGTAPTAERAEALRSRTAGNPLFVRELARLLVARGGTEERLAMPATVVDTLRQRLDRLDSSCRELLTVVAVADSADPGLLARVTGLAPDRVDALLEEAVLARVLADPEPPDRARPFVHDLYRETVLGDLSPADRRRHHATLVRTLVALAAEGEPVPAGRIATHARAALGDHEPHPAEIETAALWSVRAAEEATARLGHEEAVRHYRHAASLTVGSRDRAAVLHELGEAQLRAGDAAAGATFLEAAAAARAAGDPTALAAAALGLHRVGARRDHDVQIALLEEAITAQLDGSADRAMLLAALGRERKHALLPTDDCRRPVEEAVRLARALGDPRVLAHCLLALHDALWLPGSAAERLKVVEEAAVAAAGADDVELTTQAQVLVAACLLDLNDERGIAALAEYCRLAAELGHARGRWEELSRRATLGLVTGSLDDALTCSVDALDLGTRMGLPDAAGVHGTQRWALSRLTGGRLDLVADLGTIDVPMSAAFEAAAHRVDGDPGHARRVALTLTLDVLPESRTDLESDALAADALAAAGPTVEARRCYERLLPFAGTNVLVGGCASYWGPVDLYLGDLASGLGDAAFARRHYEAAAEMASALGATAWADHAADLGRQGGPVGDRILLTRDGDVWTVALAGAVARVPDSKGIRDLALLTGRPGADVAATELAGGRPASGADPVLDHRAKVAYRHRLEELDVEIDEAEADDDSDRAELARSERAALVAELASAVGLGGRDRRLGDDAERARKAVTGRLRDAIRRIDEISPELGAHLATTVRTGAWCSYRPE